MKNSITTERWGRKIPAQLVLTALFVFIFSISAFSQDDILLRSGTHLFGKVEEIDVNKVKYHEASNLEGPIHDVLKSDVASITYANGAVDDYTEGVAPSSAPATANRDDIPAPVKEAPPVLPVYEQPACPVEGYIWTPGYWALGIAGYYWVPGVWVNPPRPGYLWTPAYWGFENGIYVYHEGYWGEHIGYYGGVYYGFGYGGHGYDGGRWEGGVFRYNTAVSHVDVTVVHTTYEDKTVIINNPNHASFNGESGVKAEPTANEQMVMKENHLQPTTEQQTHVTAAKNDKTQYASNNGGKPAVTSMNKTNGQHYSNDGKITMPHPNSQQQTPSVPLQREDKTNQAPTKPTTSPTHAGTIPQPHSTSPQPQPKPATVPQQTHSTPSLPHQQQPKQVPQQSPKSVAPAPTPQKLALGHNTLPQNNKLPKPVQKPLIAPTGKK